jgi:pilus assembly protein CpaF
LPSAGQSDRGQAVKPALGGVRANAGRKDVGTAALPEDIIVDDARTAESDAWMKAARIVMDNYLSKNDFQSILAQPYPPEPDNQDACYNMLSQCVSETRASLGNVDINSLMDFLLKEVCGLGAVDSLIDDPDVSTFTVYNFETIVCERRGRREISSIQFTSADTLYLASQRLLAYQGINPQTSTVSEIRFEDGTQIQVILPPVAVASTSIVVRKPSHEFNEVSALIQRESLSSDMAKFLNLCVKARRNILIVGAQGAGRTSVLNALGAEIPNGERIVTVENSAVLIMPQPYVLNLEAQKAGVQNGDLASLVRQVGRLRAERVLVDTIQTPADASAFLGAICAGAQGSMATICGLNGDEGFALFKRMVASDASARSLVGNIDIVVTVRAFTDARRRIVEIAEVVDDDNGSCSLVPIFAWCGTGMGHMAMGEGQFKALGNIPKFYKELERGGMALEPSIFNA